MAAGSKSAAMVTRSSSAARTALRVTSDPVPAVVDVPEDADQRLELALGLIAARLEGRDTETAFAVESLRHADS